MATTIAYNTSRNNPTYIYRATSGGTVFSSNLSGQTAFDYFVDSPAVNDAIYFSSNGTAPFSDLYLQIGTALVGTGVTLAWETYVLTTASWVALHNLTDGSNGLTTTGSVRVRFPIQAGMERVAVNGVTSHWVRCRLVAKTTFTEGGANATTAAKISDGMVTVSGSTDGSPASFGEVYTWVNSNAAEVLATKSGNVFTFPCCRMAISSRLVSTSQTVIFGCGARYQSYDFSYLTAGAKVGTDGWQTQSNFLFCAVSDTNLVTSSANTKMYGAVLQLVSVTVNGADRVASAFLGMQNGEWIGCEIANPSGFFGNSLTSDSCVVPGNLVLTPFPTTFPSRLRIANGSSDALRFYNAGGTIANLSYNAPSNSVINRYQYSNDIDVYLRNPGTALPDQSATPKAVNRSLGTAGNLNHCFLYASSAFIDYTTASTDATANDVPLPVQIGDMLYFNPNNATAAYAVMLDFTITNQANTAIYAWEYWNGSTWVQVEHSYDLTANFTKSGRVYLGQTGTIASSAVNSTTGWWYRLRCTGAGSGSPSISKIQRYLQAGIGNSKYYEQYSVDLIVMAGGSPANSAQVLFTDADNNSQTAVSDVNGAVTKTWVPRQYFYFDPSVADANYNLNSHTQGPVLTRVRKFGYLEYSALSSYSAPFVSTVTLTADAFVASNEATAGAITGVAIDGVNRTVTVSQSRTLQEVYDYCHWWAVQAANIAYPAPMAATSASAFSSIYAWTVTGSMGGVGKTLNLGSANGAVNGGTVSARVVTTGTITLSNGGTITAGYQDATGVYVPVTISGLLSGARMQLFNVTDNSEILNALVSDTSYFALAPYTADKTWRLRVTWVSGIAAKLPFTTTGFFTSAGFSAMVTLTDDTVYAAYGLDGSAIPEFFADYQRLLVNLDDPDGATQKARLYAWAQYNLTTANGIANFFGMLVADDAANLQITALAGAFQFYNISAVPVRFTDDNIRLYRADGGSLVATNSNSMIIESGKIYLANVPDITAIKAKTDLLPADPASNTQVSTRLSASSYVSPDGSAVLTAIKAKTDNLPADPASASGVNTRLAASDYVLPDGRGLTLAQAAALQLILDIIEGDQKLDPATNQLVFTKRDHTTELARFNTKDRNGAPAVDSVYSRVRT